MEQHESAPHRRKNQESIGIVRLAREEQFLAHTSSGHVRASTAGVLSETNCHPWRMHNGQISEFGKIKRRLMDALPEPLFLFPQGHTDSEYAFALFLSHLQNPESMEEFSHRELKDAMLRTIRDINAWSREAGIQQYFSTGTSFYEQAEGAYRMVMADRRQKMVVVASEPLTFEKADWMEIESNTILCITKNMNVLQYPIVDEYHNEDPELPSRDPNFAVRAGFMPNTAIASEMRDCGVNLSQIAHLAAKSPPDPTTASYASMHPAVLIFLVSLVNQAITWAGRDGLQALRPGRVCEMGQAAPQNGQAGTGHGREQYESDADVCRSQCRQCDYVEAVCVHDPLQGVHVHPEQRGAVYSHVVLRKHADVLPSSGELVRTARVPFVLPEGACRCVDATTTGTDLQAPATVCGRVLYLIGAYCRELLVRGEPVAVTEAGVAAQASGAQKSAAGSAPAEPSAGRASERVDVPAGLTRRAVAKAE
ncbi:glutamine amidotransferase subunit [Malassezia sp. CBS 17886]|nr:glutamine amidotransferase subunit [Malassezia sp. CBS 17886]